MKMTTGMGNMTKTITTMSASTIKELSMAVTGTRGTSSGPTITITTTVDGEDGDHDDDDHETTMKTTTIPNIEHSYVYGSLIYRRDRA